MLIKSVGLNFTMVVLRSLYWLLAISNAKAEVSKVM
jgi:hypothetical protein